MDKLLPVPYNINIRKMMQPKEKGKEYNLDFEDLNDFRIPVGIFKEYSVVMKGLNSECQDTFLEAMGI